MPGFQVQGFPVSCTGRSLRWQALRRLGLAAVIAGFGLSGSLLPEGAVEAREAPQARIALPELPPEGVRTYQAIRAGGPFQYAKDGSVFGNRERRLPLRSRGFYREYTVPTPGIAHRGARRIVCGGAKPTAPESCYYTADHYTSFRLIVD
ncbi:MAG: ribonuclease N1 [Piscinibacter sp.]|nr:ribonuclease N1 [Piscinibacter sp.]